MILSLYMQKNQIPIKNIKIYKSCLEDYNDISAIEKELNIGPTSYNFFKN